MENNEVNAYNVVYSRIKWDEGKGTITVKDRDGNSVGARASIIPFKVNGVDQIPKDASNLSTWWLVHPKTEVGGVKLGSSNPSQADFNFQGLMQERGFKGNSFVVGTHDQKVSVFNADRIVVRMKYEVFKRIGSN